MAILFYGKILFISFHCLTSFHFLFISFHFLTFLFDSFHFLSFPLLSFPFGFPLFPFISFHVLFMSFHFFPIKYNFSFRPARPHAGRRGAGRGNFVLRGDGACKICFCGMGPGQWLFGSPKFSDRGASEGFFFYHVRVTYVRT